MVELVDGRSLRTIQPREKGATSMLGISVRAPRCASLCSLKGLYSLSVTLTSLKVMVRFAVQL